MEFIFKVSQAMIRKNNKPYSILPTLFEVEEKHINLNIGFEGFFENVLEFQKHLREVFDVKKYPNILIECDKVLAKADFCIDFVMGKFEKNHRISIPLTLFIQYTKGNLENVSQHIFLELIKKWQMFYDEFNKKGKAC